MLIVIMGRFSAPTPGGTARRCLIQGVGVATGQESLQTTECTFINKQHLLQRNIQQVMYRVPVKFQAPGTGDNSECKTNKDPALLKLIMSWLRYVKYHVLFFLHYFFSLQKCHKCIEGKDQEVMEK